MRARFSRRDFIKLSAAAFGGLALLPYDHWLTQFDDANLVRVASSSVSVYSEPDDKSRIVAQWYRDELIHISWHILARQFWHANEPWVHQHAYSGSQRACGAPDISNLAYTKIRVIPLV